MPIFYKNTEQISEITVYKFVLPKYGKSTTDPTYYEPQATRIANMRKSASNSVALYDFEGENIKLADNINDVHLMFGRKPGMTLEEVAQFAEQNKNSISKQSKDYEKTSKDNEKAKAERIAEAKEILNDSSNSDSEE